MKNYYKNRNHAPRYNNENTLGNYQLNIELENTGVKDDWNYIIHIIARIMHGKSLVNSIVIEGTDIGIWIDKGKTPRDFTLVKLMR